MINEPTSEPDQTFAFAQIIQRADLVIFDFDGVIADSEVISLATLRTALATFGLDMSLHETREKFLGTSIETVIAHIKTHGIGHGIGNAATFTQVWEKELFSRFKADLKPIPHVFDMIDCFDATDQQYCIASSGTLIRIKIALEAMGRLDRFAHVFSAQQVARGKPAPDLFEYAAQQMGVEPSACVVIEDSPHGVRAAKAAGMPCVGFSGGKHLREIKDTHQNRLLELGADIVLSSFAGMKRLVTKNEPLSSSNPSSPKQS